MLLWTSTDCVKLPIRQMRRLGVCWFNNSVYFFLDKCDHCCYLITVWWRRTSIPEIEMLSSLLSWHVSCPLEKHVLWAFHCTPYSGKVLTSSWNVYFDIKWKDKGQTAQLYIRNEPIEEHIRGKWGRLQLIWGNKYQHGYTLHAMNFSALNIIRQLVLLFIIHLFSLMTEELKYSWLLI